LIIDDIETLMIYTI